MAAEGGGTARRIGLWYVALNVVAVGLWVLVHFGSQTLAGAGLVGDRGMLKVTECQDHSSSTEHGGTVWTHHCYGDFRPDGGGPVVEGVELRGGSGDTYLTPSSCRGDRANQPWWCKGEHPDSVRARYVDDDAWIWGSGVLAPTGAAVMGLAVVGGGLLIGSRTLKEPRPRWLTKAPVVLCVAGSVGFVVVMLGLVTES
ncbi:hypothetical protein [Kitasatospora terrestris]|uniref:Ricin B lectin domain-containing protein n=1 Tax=Kitasatospora terrestris TaxID=258051 RepID=A0ABP9DDR1_9ACTN